MARNSRVPVSPSWRSPLLFSGWLLILLASACSSSTSGHNSSPQTQTINFAVSSPLLVAGQSAYVSAFTSSGLAASFHIDSASACPSCATLNGSTLQAVSAGTLTLVAEQAGGTAKGITYQAASQSLTVTVMAAASTAVLSLDATQITVPRASGEVQIAVNRRILATGAIQVSYATQDGTAVAGTDYTATSGTLTWADGDATSQIVTVPITTSASSGTGRSFTLHLSSPSGTAILDSAPVSTVTIAASPTAPSTFSQFDFTLWNLTLPIDAYGGTGGSSGTQYSAQTIQASLLATGFTDPYFYLDANNNVVFTAPSNGAVTPNSGHTRSELRELYSASNAVGDLEWDSSIGGSMSAACRVFSVASASDEATVAQVHSTTLPFFLLLYRPETQDVVAKIYDTPTDSSSYTLTELAYPIYYGDLIDFTLQYSGSTITVTLNGAATSLTVNSTWTDTPVYFKVGAYSAAANTGNPTRDQTQQSCAAFSVSH